MHSYLLKNIRNYYQYTLLIISLLLTSAFADEQEPYEQFPSPFARTANWSRLLSDPDLHKFYKISDDIYVSNQPDAKGYAAAKRRGIKTLINLRHWDRDAEVITALGLTVYRIPLKSWLVKEEQIDQFLELISDSSKAPFLVYCRDGSDRIGLIIAVYRVVVENWRPTYALQEWWDYDLTFNTPWNQHLLTMFLGLNFQEKRDKWKQTRQPTLELVFEPLAVPQNNSSQQNKSDGKIIEAQDKNY